VLTELKNRGVEDVCIIVCDGLKGLPELITTTWELATVQTCIIHLIRNARERLNRTCHRFLLHARTWIGVDCLPGISRGPGGDGRYDGNPVNCTGNRAAPRAELLSPLASPCRRTSRASG
jgi:hypothetical protein